MSMRIRSCRYDLRFSKIPIDTNNQFQGPFTFEVKASPNPFTPHYPPPSPTRVKDLEHLVKMYQALLAQRNYYPAPLTNTILMEKGLHKDSPKQRYVKPAYFAAVAKARKSAKTVEPAEEVAASMYASIREAIELIEMLDGEDCV